MTDASPPPSPLPVAHAVLAEALLPAVLAAGRVQVAYMRAGVEVRSKADASPVTAADSESEAILLAALAAVAPALPVVAEEAMAAGACPRLEADGSGAFFLVDPLDGTREFIAGRPEYTINVALVLDRVPRFGIIYAPASGRLFATLADDRVVEAQVVPDAAAAGVLAGATPIRVRVPGPEGLVAAVSRSHKTAATDAFLARFDVVRRQSIGSSLKFALLARGEADLYARIGPTSEWDTAAGHAILLAAGGRVTALDGGPFLYGKVERRFLNGDFLAWGGGSDASGRPASGWAR